MFRFMDRVRVKDSSGSKIIAPGQQSRDFFSGHEGYVVGQKKDQSYMVWFPCKHPETIEGNLMEADLDLIRDEAAQKDSNA